jgi:hypothetical protein
MRLRLGVFSYYAKCALHAKKYPGICHLREDGMIKKPYYILSFKTVTVLSESALTVFKKFAPILDIDKLLFGW